MTEPATQIQRAQIRHPETIERELFEQRRIVEGLRKLLGDFAALDIGPLRFIQGAALESVERVGAEPTPESLRAMYAEEFAR
jgi:hypothetical protein